MMRSKAVLLPAAACLAGATLVVPAVFARAATTSSALDTSKIIALTAPEVVAAAGSGAESISPVLSVAPPLSGAQAIGIPSGAPLNDTCAGALEIPACGAFPKLTDPVQITMATICGDPVPSCERNATAGIWYSFTPEISATYEFTTCQNLAPGTTAQDTVLALFHSQDNHCPSAPVNCTASSLPRIACNDNDSDCAGHEDQSRLRAPLTAGKTYFLLAYSVSPAPGAIVQVHIAREPVSRQCIDADLDGTADPCLPNGGFETGGFDGWMDPGTTDADIAIVPKDPPPACFQPDMPSEGCYMACLSTGSFFGGAANGSCSAGGSPHDGVRSDLVSEPINFAFRPGSIEVSFTVEFQTEEGNIPSIVTNDAFQARLVTRAGTFVIIQIDTFGRTPVGRGLRVEGASEFLDTTAGCPLMGHRTGPLKVTWSKPIDAALRGLIQGGPVFLEFSVSDQGNPDLTSIACVDDVRIKASRPQ